MDITSTLCVQHPPSTGPAKGSAMLASTKRPNYFCAPEHADNKLPV